MHGKIHRRIALITLHYWTLSFDLLFRRKSLLYHGRIGLLICLKFAHAGFRTIGIDITLKMPDHVINLILDAFSESKKNVVGSQIAILGLSYKPHVKDIQLTPAKPIIDRITSHKIFFVYFEIYYCN